MDRVAFLSPRDLDHPDDHLPNLKGLFIGRSAALVFVAGVTPNSRVFPPLPESLRVLHLNTNHAIFQELCRYPAPLVRPSFSELESFTFSADSYNVDTVLDLLRPSLEAGSLRTLDIGMPMSDPLMPGLNEQASAVRILRFVDNPALLSSVTTVGMSGFRFRGVSYRASLSAEPFALWVKKFPAVRVVHAYPELFENAGDVVPALISVVEGVKTIYQNCLRGELRSRVLPWAAKKGVKIVDTKESWAPVQFPYVFEVEDVGNVEAQGEL